MKTLTAAAVAALLAGSASASQPTITWLPPGYLLTSLSQHGDYGAGNIYGPFETFRWEASTNTVTALGRSTVDTLGGGSGSPDISWDGTSISATILTSDGLYMTAGVWSTYNGWIECMPPMPADAKIQDLSMASAWGLSGNGAVLTGLYNILSGQAVPMTWSLGTGTVRLPSTNGKNARVNAANYNGSVVVGWEDTLGPWWPMAWRSGVRMPLVPYADVGGGGQAQAVNGDGSVIVGYAWDPALITRVATLWTWNGASYDINHVGYLPGTIFNRGFSYFMAVSNDGKIAGGTNQYTNNPGGTVDGIIWTQATGLIKITDYITSLGLTIPENVAQIPEVAAISPDGLTITCIAMTTDVGYQSLVIKLPPPCPADTNGDGVINTLDLGTLLSHFGQSVTPSTNGDINGDGVVNTLDLGSMLSLFGSSCP